MRDDSFLKFDTYFNDIDKLANKLLNLKSTLNSIESSVKTIKNGNVSQGEWNANIDRALDYIERTIIRLKDIKKDIKDVSLGSEIDVVIKELNKINKIKSDIGKLDAFKEYNDNLIKLLDSIAEKTNVVEDYKKGLNKYIEKSTKDNEYNQNLFDILNDKNRSYDERQKIYRRVTFSRQNVLKSMDIDDSIIRLLKHTPKLKSELEEELNKYKNTYLNDKYFDIKNHDSGEELYKEALKIRNDILNKITSTKRFIDILNSDNYKKMLEDMKVDLNNVDINTVNNIIKEVEKLNKIQWIEKEKRSRLNSFLNANNGFLNANNDFLKNSVKFSTIIDKYKTSEGEIDPDKVDDIINECKQIDTTTLDNIYYKLKPISLLNNKFKSGRYTKDKELLSDLDKIQNKIENLNIENYKSEVKDIVELLDKNKEKIKSLYQNVKETYAKEQVKYDIAKQRVKELTDGMSIEDKVYRLYKDIWGYNDKNYDKVHEKLNSNDIKKYADQYSNELLKRELQKEGYKNNHTFVFELFMSVKLIDKLDDLLKHIDTEIKDEIKPEIKVDPQVDIKDNREEIKEEIENKIVDQIKEEIKPEIKVDPKVEIKDNKEEIKEEIENKIEDQIKEEIKPEVKVEPKVEIKEDTKEDIKEKIKDKIEDQIKEEIKHEIQVEPQVDIKDNTDNNTKKLNDKLDKIQTNKLDELKKKVKDTINAISEINQAINQAVTNIIAGIRKAFSIIRQGWVYVGKGITLFRSGVSHIIQLFGNLGNRVRNTFNIFHTGSYNANRGLLSLSGSAVDLYAKLKLLEMAINAVFNNEYIKRATELYKSVYSLKNIVGTQLTEDTIDWAKSMERAFGISARQLIADMNELSGVLYGLGMNAEHVAIGSQNLLMISRYLAFMGAAGGDVNVVTDKLISGMKGMTQSIDDLGLSVREAQMDAFLKKLKAQGGEFANIGTSFANLNEEARVYVRYASLIDQFTSKYKLEGFADALNTVAGRLDILKQTLYSLGTTLGQVFVKLFSYVAPAITAILMYIQEAIVKLANFLSKILGIDLSTELQATMGDGAAKGLEKASAGAANLNKKLNDTKKAAQEVKGSLAGFDKITSISSDSGSGSDKDNGDGFDYSKLMVSALDNLNRIALESKKSFADRVKEGLEEGFNRFKNKVSESLRDITGRQYIDLGFDKTKIKNNLIDILKNIFGTIKELGLTIISIGVKIADDVNIGAIITSVTDLIKAISELALTVSKELNKSINDFYDKHLKEYFEELGKNIKDVIDSITANIKKLNEDISNNGLFSSNNETFNKVVDIIKTIIDIVGTLYKDIIKPLMKEFGDFIKGEFLDWLNEELKQISKFIKEHKEDIKDLIKAIGRISWEAFKKLVDITEALVKLVVEHPGAVVAFFAGLVAIKITTWAIDSAIALGKLAESIGVIKALFAGAAKGGGLLASLGITFSASTVGIIIAVVAAIVALVAVIKDLWNTSESFRNSITDTWNNVKDNFSENIEKISASFDRLKEAWDNIYKSYESSGLKKVVEFLLVNAFKEICRVINNVIDILGILITVVIDVFTGIFNIVAGVVNIFKGLFDVIIGIFTLDFEKIRKGFDGLGLGITQVFTGALQALWGLVAGVINIGISIANNLFNGLLSGIEKSWDNVWKSVSGFFNKLITKVKDLLGIHSPSTVFADIGRNIIQGLIKGIDSLYDTIINKINRLAINIGTAFDKVKNGISKGWDSIKEFGISIYNNVTGKTQVKQIPPVTYHAVGGGISKGRIFIAGENGPELVGSIRGAGTSDVANNSMIIKALKDAMTDGVLDGVYELVSQLQGMKQTGEVHIHLGENGLNIYDQASLNKIANILAPYINKNSIKRI